MSDRLGDTGRVELLGERHAAVACKRGPVLLVSFELAATVRATQADAMPHGYHIAARNGYSSLSILARTPSWFRDPSVYLHFDRLADRAHFERFDRVVFYGAGMGGYAACAFSAAAPGATVIALAPQATLDPRVTGWDVRFPSMRRTSFIDRYGYGPDMIEAADRVYLAYDPQEHLDAMHAALYTMAHITMLPCPDLGPEIAAPLAAMGVLDAVIEAACEDRLDAGLFWRLYRARRDHAPYLRRLSSRLEDAGRLRLNTMLCHNVSARLDQPRFRARLGDLRAQVDAGTRAVSVAPLPA